MAQLFPSLISANLLRLQEDINFLEPLVPGFHIDVMDFHFVPNLTWGPAFINEIRKATTKQLFVHLMVEYPENYFDRMELHVGDIVSVHYEACSTESIDALLQKIASKKWIPSVALNPATPISVLDGIESKNLKHCLVMTVEPGFSGQKFIPEMLEKINELEEWKEKNHKALTIAVDGGITLENCAELVINGAEQLCVASAIFGVSNEDDGTK